MAPARKKRTLRQKNFPSPFKLSKIVPKLAEDSYSMSASLADSAKKGLFSLGVQTKKSIKKKSKELYKTHIGSVPKVKNARAFMDLLPILNEKWIPSPISGDIYARGVERFMKKHESEGTRHIIGEKQIQFVQGMLMGPVSHSQIPEILGTVLGPPISAEKVSDMLDVLFKDYVLEEQAYKAAVEPGSGLRPEGIGFLEAGIRKKEKNVQELLRTNMLAKLEENLQKQQRFLKAGKSWKPSVTDKFQMKSLQKEALKLIDDYKEEYPTDPHIDNFFLTYVLPLNNKFPELVNYNARGAQKRKGKKKKASTRKKKKASTGKKKKKKKKKGTTRRSF